ncbi:sugar ABC transporter permease [Candidatus Aerophobetes bacterium]|nr:sugar ABC transporter permease [Candidatus Aerophobetes bacterium]
MLRRKPLIFLLVIPFSFFILSHTIPFFYGIGLSFYDWRENFVGFTNYLSVFNDAVFWESLKFTFIYAVVVAGAMTFFGLFFGIFINHLGRGQMLVKSVLLIPWAISLTAWGLLGQIALSRQFGVVNDVLVRLGILESRLAWLGDPTLAKISVMLSRISKDVWFSALLFLVARQTIPSELYDESKVCGAGPWQTLCYVTLPMLKPTMLFVTTILFIFALQEFDLVFALTRGGPGFATEVASINIFRHGVRYGNYEYGTAVAAVWSLIVSVFVIVVFAPLQRRIMEK